MPDVAKCVHFFVKRCTAFYVKPAIISFNQCLSSFQIVSYSIFFEFWGIFLWHLHLNVTHFRRNVKWIDFNIHTSVYGCIYVQSCIYMNSINSFKLFDRQYICTYTHKQFHMCIHVFSFYSCWLRCSGFWTETFFA